MYRHFKLSLYCIAFVCLFGDFKSCVPFVPIIKQTVNAAEKPKSIKVIMKEAHKSGLSKRAVQGKASDEELKKLVDYYKQLIKHKAPRGSQDEWKKRTKALLDAAEKLVAGDESAKFTLSKAVNCKQCHRVHKPE